MAKITLNDVTSGYYSTTKLNDNFTAIEVALENTLSRDGTSPNQMEADFDLNGFKILNHGNPLVVDGLNWRDGWATATSYLVGDIVNFGGSAYICIVDHTSGVFATDLVSVYWQLFAEASLPTQTGNANKFLQTDGSMPSWEVPDAAEVSNTPAGTIVATTVQAAINELDTDKQPLDATLTALASVLTAANKIPYATALDTAGELDFKDEDDMASNSAVALPSQQSVKTYADAIKNGGTLVAGTVVASTSGTSIDFTGIPSWAKRITVMMRGVSVSGTSNQLIQLGTSDGVVATGYIATEAHISGTSANTVSATNGFVIVTGGAAGIVSGTITICRIDTNIYVASGVVKAATTVADYLAGDVNLGGVLDRIRITTVGGTDTFDAGSINILYE